MKKLKLLLTLLLLCAGVGNSWAQTYTKGTQVTSIDQLSTDKLYFLEHTYIGTDNSASYHYMYMNGLKTETPAQYVKFNLNYNNTLPETNNSFYVWRLVPSATAGRYYLQNVGNPDCYVLQLTGWGASFAGKSGTKGDFTITESGVDDTFKFCCENHIANGHAGEKYIGGMNGTSYGNGISGVCGDEGTKHVQKIYEANLPSPADYSTNYADVTLGRKDRAVTEIKLTTSVGTQTITECQSSTQNPTLYIDKTSQKFTCVVGEPITAKVTSGAGWTHLYVYVDKDGDGFDCKTDVANHRALEGSDLKAWTHYKFGGDTGYNSLGQETGGGVGLGEIPSFKAPTTPGTYRMRFKTDWNSINPRGDLGDGRGASATEDANNNIVKNGGAIIDIMLEVTNRPIMHTVTYVDKDNNPLSGIKAVVNTGKYSFIEDGVNMVECDATANSFICTTDFLLRDLVSISANGNTYDTWADLTTAVTGAANVVVKLGKPAVQAGKYYTFKNTVNSRVIYDNPSGTNGGENLTSEVVAVGNMAGKHVFKVEDATNGKFYLKNAETGRYVRYAAAAGDNKAHKTTTTLSDAGAFWITNAIVTGSPNIFAIGGSSTMTNPIASAGDNLFLHTNNQNTVVPWKATEAPSQWYVEEVPVITVKFQAPDGTELTGIEFNADGSPDALKAQSKVLATVRNFVVNGYAVVARQLNGVDYSTRANFYAAVAALEEDAEAVITLRTRTEGEVDFTIDLFNENGDYFDNTACTGDAATTRNAAHSAWKLNVNHTSVAGIVPADLELRVWADSENGKVGGQIYDNGNAQYRYKQQSSGNNCLTFLSAPLGEGNDTNAPYVYKMSVSGNDTYYILQYEMGIIPNSVDFPQEFLNEGNSTVLTANPKSGALNYNITDTPAGNETWFSTRVKAYTKSNPTEQNLTDAKTSQQPSAANFFQVRIVNQTYLENSMGYGRSVCWKALQGKVGYPAEGDERAALETALSNFNTEETIANYCAMLKAYSKFISCRELNLGDDCAVYTLSFIDNNGDKHLLENVDGTLNIVDYTEVNRIKKSARWISHKQENGKMVFVNKEDGKYLQAKTTGTEAGLSTYYDANTTAFTVEGIHQDINDYMQSATDEKLLGAVYMQSDGRVSGGGTCTLTMQCSDNTWSTNSNPRYDNITAAIAIEEVENGNTFNEIQLRQASDNKYYATYYSFYPVAKPSGTSMYYVNSVSESGVMELIKVQADVIRPNFAVILISDDEFLYQEESEDDEINSENKTTHLHIGEYTSDVEAEIAGYLTGKQNLLQGTTEAMATSAATTVDGESGQVYVLSGKKDNKVGFYPYTAANLPIGRAYYVHPATASGSGNIRAFHFTDENGVETTIELNAAETSADAVIYDLSGRRVNNATHGLFIINGKKVVK